MANVRLAYNDVFKGGFNAYGDGWSSSVSNYANLSTLSLAQRWISAGLGSTDMRIPTFSVPGNATVAAIVLANHNLSLSATVRIMASNSAGFSPMVYDSGALPVFAAGVTQASRAGMRWNFAHVLSAATSATRWRIEFSDASNPAGYLAVGKLCTFTDVWQPSINMEAGAAIGWTDPTDVQTALSGAEWFVDKEPYRSARFRLGPLYADEMLGRGFDLQRVAAGTNREVWFQYDPSDGVHSVRRSFYGRVRQLSQIEEPYSDGMTTAFEFKELL